MPKMAHQQRSIFQEQRCLGVSPPLIVSCTRKTTKNFPHSSLISRYPFLIFTLHSSRKGICLCRDCRSCPYPKPPRRANASPVSSHCQTTKTLTKSGMAYAIHCWTGSSFLCLSLRANNTLFQPCWFP